MCHLSLSVSVGLTEGRLSAAETCKQHMVLVTAAPFAEL